MMQVQGDPPVVKGVPIVQTQPMAVDSAGLHTKVHELVRNKDIVSSTDAMAYASSLR